VKNAITSIDIPAITIGNKFIESGCRWCPNFFIETAIQACIIPLSTTANIPIKKIWNITDKRIGKNDYYPGKAKYCPE